MKKENVFHFVFCEQNKKNEDQMEPFVYSMLHTNIPCLFVIDIPNFEMFLEKFEVDQLITVWVHHQAIRNPYGIYEGENTGAKLISKYPNIKFKYITRAPAHPSISEDKNRTPIISLNDIYEEIEKFENFQKISDIITKDQQLTAANKANQSLPDFDFAIINALYEDEFQSVSKIFNLVKHENLKLGDKNVFTGALDSFPNKKILAVYQSEVGRTDASSIVTDVIKEFRPRYIFMTGVCGGDADIPLGSIVVAKFVFTFDKGKITDKGFFRELEFVKIHESSLRQIRESNEKILNEVKVKLISDTTISERFKEFNFQELRAIIDPVACSSAVIDKENYFTEVIKTIERKATAVEMESYGIARGAETTNSGKTRSIIIKSVMDNTTGKNDKAKSFASYTSALYLKCLLENGIIE
jgi:nucleoside phosphorylase